MNKILSVIAKIVFSLIWIALLLSVLLCPNYIANPVISFSLIHFLSDKPFVPDGVLRWIVVYLDYGSTSVLKLYFITAILAIFGACSYCLVRKLQKAHIPSPISKPGARWKKKLAFGLLLLMIVLVRPNPVMSTLLAPLAKLKLPIDKLHLFGWSPLSVTSGVETYCYTLLTGQYFTLHVTFNDGMLTGTLNYPYLIHMILIAVFVAVTRFGVTARDKWLRHAQSSQPGKTQMPE